MSDETFDTTDTDDAVHTEGFDGSPEKLPGEAIKQGITRQLPVLLTTEELAQRARGVGERAAELAKLRADIAERTKLERTRLKNAETDFERLVETLRTGTEDRLVTCHERYHAGTILTVRDDTHEVLANARPANQAERQLALPEQPVNTGLLDDAARVQQGANVEEDDEGDVIPLQSAAGGKKRGRKGGGK